MKLKTIIRVAVGSGLLGICFLADWPGLDWQQVLIVLVLVSLGLNLIWAGCKDRTSWMEKIGPLP